MGIRHLLPFLDHAQAMTLPAGSEVFHQGDDCGHYVVVRSGSIKVFARSAEGKEVVLYRISEGEVCVLTTSCLLGNRRYPAEAVCETDVVVYLLQKAQFDQQLNSSETFRQFVFASFGERLADLMGLIEQVALDTIEQRLANYLLHHHDAQQQIHATHQVIASEIGSAREVVSRQLKTFEKQQLVALSRGQITLLDADALAQRASHHIAS